MPDPALRIDTDFELLGIHHQDMPELALLVAILERSILDLMCVNEKEVEYSREYLFESNVDLATPFSFPWICQHLNIDIENLRSKIIKDIPRLKARKMTIHRRKKTIE